MKQLEKKIWTILLIVLTGNIALWLLTNTYKSKWINVPPPPSALSAASAGLGDTHFAYRNYSIVLQNMGDIGGRTTNLRDYDFKNVGAWFDLLHHFDPQSNFLPYLASFYFGGADLDDPQRLRPLVNYLEKAGRSNFGEKWRWLAQAVYIARFKMKDLDTALRLSRELAKIDNPDMPQWARNMPANVLNAQGDKEAALNLLLSILQSSAEKMHPSEVNATVAYICEQIYTPEEAEKNELCDNI